MAAKPQPEPSPEQLEPILAEILGHDDRSAALAEACERHAEWSTQLRSAFAALEHHQLLAEPTPTFAAIESLDGFRLGEVLGRGGMGVVYRAIDQKLGREVALKVLRPELLHFEDSRRRFQREIESASRLRHPGIVSVHSAGGQHDVPYFTMELVDGASLSKTIANLRGQPMSARRGEDLHAQFSHHESTTHHLASNWIRACLQITRMIAEALQHAHEQGVIHRDVKPSNVLVDEHGRARLLDFGLARLESGQQLTKSTSMLGSLPYMPPELVDARLPEAGARQDVYSLGVTLYELLTLQQPFLATSSEETRRRVQAGEYMPLRQREATISRECAIVCQKAMEVDPSRRYATAREFADDLDNLLERRPIHARPSGIALKSWRFAQRHPTGLTATVLGLLVVALSVTAMLAAQEARDIERQAAVELIDSNLDFVFEFAQGLQRIPGNTELRVKLLRRAAAQLAQLEDKPGLDATRLGRLGEAHLALAQVLGRPNKTNIGQRDAAEERYRHVLNTLAPRLAGHSEAGAALLASRAAVALAEIAQFDRELDRATAILEQADASLTPHLVDAPATRLQRSLDSQFLRVQSRLASIAGSQRRHAEAMRRFEVLRQRRRLHALARPGDSDAQFALASASADVGIAMCMSGDAKGAANEYRPYIEQLEARRLQAPDDAMLAFTRIRRGVPFLEILIKAGELPEAIEEGQRVLALCDEQAKADPNNANLPRFRVALAYNVGWAHQDRASAAIAAGESNTTPTVRSDLQEALRWLQVANKHFADAAAAGRLDKSAQQSRIEGRIAAIRALLDKS